jgi:hypothetical protein
VPSQRFAVTSHLALSSSKSVVSINDSQPGRCIDSDQVMLFLLTPFFQNHDVSCVQLGLLSLLFPKCMHAVAGIASSSNAQGASTSQGSASGQAATLASLPPTGPYSRNRRNSGSTVGMDTAVARRMQANRQSMYPESTYSESEWGD